MIRLPTLTAAALAALLATTARGLAIETSDPTCNIPPSGSWATDATGTSDVVYLPMWANSDAAFDDFFSGLQGEADDWDEGWGWGDRTNLTRGLARLINAAQTTWMVHQFARHQGFGLWRPVAGIPHAHYQQGRWWDFVAGYGADEWEPGCDITLNGSHNVDVDEYNNLETGGAYMATGVQRGATLVHETTHQDVDHVDEEACSPDNESCDSYYGAYNANTMQINFLHDAYVATQLAVVNNQVVRDVAFNGLKCFWPSTFSPNERASIEAAADSTMERFGWPAWSGWKTSLRNQVDAEWDKGVWDCPHCDPEDHDWQPDVCEQVACNEQLNSQNIGVNDNNRAECEEYNAAIEAPGADADTVAWAQQQKLMHSLACLPPAAGPARAYCDAQKATATNVSGIDECGWLDPIESDVVTKLDCVEEWCHDELLAHPTASGEHLGCADYVCGNFVDQVDGCSPGDVSVSECKWWYGVVRGDPSLFLAACEWDECKAKKIECLQGHFANGTWTYGDPVPGECVFAEQLCHALSRVALEAFIDQRPFLDPGPYRDRIEGIHTMNPGKNVYRFADDIRRAAAAGAAPDTLDAMAAKMTSTPEMIVALFHAAPAEFVGLFGKDGFERILGPRLQQIEGRALTPESLGPRGQAALAEFQRLLSLQGGVAQGTLGTFRLR